MATEQSVGRVRNGPDPSYRPHHGRKEGRGTLMASYSKSATLGTRVCASLPAESSAASPGDGRRRPAHRTRQASPRQRKSKRSYLPRPDQTRHCLRCGVPIFGQRPRLQRFAAGKANDIATPGVAPALPAHNDSREEGGKQWRVTGKEQLATSSDKQGKIWAVPGQKAMRADVQQRWARAGTKTNQTENSSVKREKTARRKETSAQHVRRTALFKNGLPVV